MNKSENPRRAIDPNKPKVKLPSGPSYREVRDIVNQHKLHTICQSGNCPNIGECWNAGTATFMILGNICTRSCRFCSVPTGKPLPPDPGEPERIAQSILLMKLKHCVITSVDRDDLPDGGAAHWKTTIEAVRRLNPSITMEVLIPDFKGNTELVDKIIEARPDIISHNLETVERLSRQVRIQARYERSLNVLRHIAEQGIRAKSGIMLGLGETEEEIIQTLSDLLRTGCRIVTIGQYLQPEPNCLPVLKYYSENEYITFAETALKMGFLKAESGRLVRSSYHAETHIG